MKIYLASTSPRRKRLLAEICEDFTTFSPDIEEKEYPKLTPEQKAVRRSKDKCIASVNGIKDRSAVVISSDTVVDFSGRTLDKPADEKECFEMISNLSDNFHYVHTAVSLYFKGTMYTFCDTTEVHFKHIPQDVISRYVKEDTAYDKRGGYGIQTPFGKEYIDKIDGDYNTVVGLPLKKLEKLLKSLNIL